jgi:aspartate aminotransferase
MQFSSRFGRIRPPASFVISQRARDLKAQGRDVIALSAGEPDFDTPMHIQEAAARAAAAGHTKYPPIPGIPQLKDAVSRKFARDNGLNYAPNEILISNGVKQVIGNAMLATVDHGDEVIVPAPYWVSYPEITAFCGGIPVILATSAATGFKITAAQLEAAITPKTRWLVLNSPCNPSGAVYSRGELSELAQVLLRQPHVLVLCDDIYEHLIYDGIEFSTIAQVEPGLRDRTLTCNGVSKAYAMPGWRVGFGGGPAALIKAMETVQSQMTSGVNQISQWAAKEALDGPQHLVGEWRAEFQARRDLVVKRLKSTPGLSCTSPSGAFYAYPSCGDLLGRMSPRGVPLYSDEIVATELLLTEGVALVHGSAFGCAPHVRVSYAASREKLIDACTRIERFCTAVMETKRAI